MIRRRHLGLVLFCVLAVGWGTDPSQARFLSPREAKKTPRARIACLPSPTMGVRYIGADDLGQHAYKSGRREGNGIMYTCRGGHIDITHLRKIADWTAHLAYHTRDALVQSQGEFTFKMHEPSKHYVQLEYPAGWKYLGPKTKHAIATEISVCLGQYLAYTASVWHEILTWHGFKAIGFYPEYNSAFSWEDNYSNALGAYIGGLALRDRDHAYNQATTLLVDRELERLNGQSKGTARQAGAAVKGSWFVGAFIRVTMVKRHLDVGLDDGLVTPWLVPDVAECGAPKPWLCPVPDLSLLEEYGFRIKHEIEPREWEKYEILRAVYPDRKERKKRIEPTKHFGVILEHVRAKANKRYGPFAHLHQTPATDPGQAHMAQDTSSASISSDANLPAHQAGLVETTHDSSRDTTVYVNPAQDRDQEGRKKNLFGFLGSAVSWLTDGAL